MSRRRISHSEMNESLAYPFMQTNGQYNGQSNGQHRRGPIEGPNGRRLIRRVTWRSSTYKLMATLWVLAVLYIVWLVRDLFMPFTPSETDTPPASQDQN
ncbi:uncharacterized protein N7479_002934 [Penicillium vulpinum]|uniref:uncharacterized protein n=1 Tax=Penicillium vulpinum TaxID=29845 RepID=UPI002547436D|nr:uncharacterized protein N7479_002934 [Penicillium vulpinum]KAJ5973016.1 hypothetical protein N7479_002934 [Penicillium vulpinum]